MWERCSGLFSAGPGCLSAEVRRTEISYSAPREQPEKKLHNGDTGRMVDVNRLHHVVMKQKVSWDDIHGSQTSTWKWRNLIPGIEKRSLEKKDGEQVLRLLLSPSPSVGFHRCWKLV